MAIDDLLPGQDPGLGSATFAGYYSVLRSGWNTPDETAAWVVNGDFYRDHRSNDAGNLVLFVLNIARLHFRDRRGRPVSERSAL